MAIRCDINDEYCFIIDLLYLDANCWILLDSIVKDLFMNDDIIKIGQSIKNDVIELCQSYPQISGFKVINKSLDTNDMYKLMHKEARNMISLKQLVRVYLHADLIKTQQCSDWSVRPLSEEQCHYACCDALVLLRIYDAMVFDADRREAAAAAVKRERQRSSSTASDDSVSRRTRSNSNSSSFDADTFDYSKYEEFDTHADSVTSANKTTAVVDAFKSCYRDYDFTHWIFPPSNGKKRKDSSSNSRFTVKPKPVVIINKLGLSSDRNGHPSNHIHFPTETPSIVMPVTNTGGIVSEKKKKKKKKKGLRKKRLKAKKLV